jgi:hypothetical protein
MCDHWTWCFGARACVVSGPGATVICGDVVGTDDSRPGAISDQTSRTCSGLAPGAAFFLPRDTSMIKNSPDRPAGVSPRA